MWTDVWSDTKPKIGSRIIVLFVDGSGCKLLAVTKDGFIDEDGESYESDYLSDTESFSSWAYLPDGLKLWCEVRSWPEPLKLDA
jgi:hypothetical protein